MVLFFFMGDTVSGDLPPERRQGAAPVSKRAKYYTRGRIIMEFMTGKTEKKTVLISDILSGEYEGKEVLLNGLHQTFSSPQYHKGYLAHVTDLVHSPI